MQFYRKLSTLRKEAGLSQEQLAEKAGVSRQTIFKWESELASPSMENILTLSRLFCVSADELIGNEAFVARESEESLGKEDGRTPQNTSDQEDERGAFTAEQGGEKTSRQYPAAFFFPRFHYEYKSKRTLFGLPLVHIHVGTGLYKAKGIIAIGNLACGIISLGMLSVGILSLGVLSLGLLALGALAAGGISAGAISAGIFALGAVALGIVAVGGVAVGVYAMGGVAVASRIAATSMEGFASAPLVIADGAPKGSYTKLVCDFQSLVAASSEMFSSVPRWLLRFFSAVA